jgi:hypothetical protein
MTNKVYNRSFSGVLYLTSDSFAFPGPRTFASSTESTTVKNVDTFAGNDRPGWKDAIRQQVSATTQASGRKTFLSDWPIISANVFGRLNQNPVTYQDRHYSLIGYPAHWISFASLASSSVDTNTLNHVTARVDKIFLDRCKSAISSFQSGQDIVEIKQTIESIIHPLSSLRKHVSTYFLNLAKIKGKYKRIRTLSGRNRSLAKALSDTYLEWTFGWNPLASDIAAGIVDLSKSRNRFESTPVHASAKGIYEGTSSDLVNTNADHCFIVGSQKFTAEYSIRLKGAVNAYYQGTAPTLRQNLQLLPEDFAPTVWNVLPYSFVIDYFLNVGDIVNAYSFPSVALRWCNKSTRDLSRTQIQFSMSQKLLKAQFAPPWEILSAECSPANFDASVILFSRTSVDASDLIPPLVFEIPGLTEKPWRNIAALVFGSKRLVVPYTFN